MTELENLSALLHFCPIPLAQRTVLPNVAIQRRLLVRPVLPDSPQPFHVSQGDRPAQPILLTSFHHRRLKSRAPPPRRRRAAPRSADLRFSTFAPSACFPMRPLLAQEPDRISRVAASESFHYQRTL